MILKTIKDRRSIHPPKFNNEPVTKEEIQILLEAANWAPSHRKTEPWRFKVCHSLQSRIELGKFMAKVYKQKTDKFSEAKYLKILEKPTKSGAVIAICMQRDENKSVPEWEEVSAVAMAVQNLWLQATEVKLGGYWSSPAMIIEEYHHFLDAHYNEKCLGFFFLGHCDTIDKESTRGAIADKTVWL